MLKHKYQAYAAATHTEATTQHIIRLYDGAIRFMQQAKQAVAEQKIEERYLMLSKASRIVLGLQASLDFDAGNDIAKILYNFYAAIDNRIFSIHRTASEQVCDEVIAELKKMRDVWQEIDRNKAIAAPVAADAATPPPAAERENIVISA